MTAEEGKSKDPEMTRDIYASKRANEVLVFHLLHSTGEFIIQVKADNSPEPANIFASYQCWFVSRSNLLEKRMPYMTACEISISSKRNVPGR